MCDQLINLKFVGEVEKHEVLYNYTLPGYSRREVTEKAWHEVAAQTNLTVSDCKDKWRNLRTVFIRHMKPTSKRAYYLADAMRFCVPFIKSMYRSSPGKLRPVTHKQQFTCDIKVEDSDTQGEDNATHSEDNASQGDDNSLQGEDNVSKGEDNVVDVEDSVRQVEECTQQTFPRTASLSTKLQTSIFPQFCTSHLGPTAQPREIDSSASVADHYIAEYFEAKKAKLCSNAERETDCQRIDRQQGIRMFLLSLIPELEELSNVQIKLFKRRVFQVIDEIAACGPKP